MEVRTNGYAGNASTTPTSKRLSTTASTPCLQQPQHGIALAASPRFADPVNRLGCLRGIAALTGLALTVEIGD